MKWPLAHILGSRPRPEETVVEQAGAESEPPACSYPRLALLVHDAAGPAAYRLHTFEDAPSAAAFVEYWFRSQPEHGILAFWISHQEAAWQADSNEERPGEAVILIRDEDMPDIVYPFSYSDMGQAHSRIEMEATRGLDLGLVLLYWAVSVRIETDGRGVVRFSPATPPMGRDRDETRAGSEAEPALLEAKDRGVGLEMIDLEIENPGADVWLDTPMMVEEVYAEPREEAGAAVLQPVEGDGDQDQVVEAQGKAEVSVEDEEAVERSSQRDDPLVAEDGDTADESVCDQEEVPTELANLLKVRRWRQLEEPFKGFSSPEGKF